MDIVISGSSNGIGRATAELFLEKGHRVFGVDIAPVPILGERFVSIQVDIRDRSSLKAACAAVGGVEPHVLICSAGTLEEVDAIDVNLLATIDFVRHFYKSPNLRSILFVASASARNGAEFPLYVASKAGLVGYMKNLALRAARRGITCNSISPGGVVTQANHHILASPELYQAVKDETLLGKWAEPEEIAEFAYFLTVHNRSMTGEDILIDNGEMLKSNFIW